MRKRVLTLLLLICAFVIFILYIEEYKIQKHYDTIIIDSNTDSNNINFDDENSLRDHNMKRDPFRNTVFLITPTYSRMTQKADLVSLRSTLMNVNFVHWIIVEDASMKTKLVANFLNETTVPWTHLCAPSTPIFSLLIKGINQRNKGLDWIRGNLIPNRDTGVVYFADDDNTYDPRIFEEMRTTKRVSTWPVGHAGGILWEGCITEKINPNKITKFRALFRPSREFPIDMAAFAINIDLLFKYPEAKFNNFHPGKLEGDILTQLGIKSAFELEPKASGCKKMLVWHTSKKRPKVKRLGAIATPLDDFV